MKNAALVFISFLLAINLGCKDDDCFEQDNLDLFDELWYNFNHEYAAFEVLGIDWDSIRAIYRPMINESSSDEELFVVFKSMLYTLEDAHSDLHTGTYLRSIAYYYEVTENAPRNYIGWLDMQDIYLENVVEINNQLAYAKIKKENIGYIRVRDFSGDGNNFEFIDDLLSEYPTLDGLVVDIRNNGGGNENNGQKIAGRFTENKTIYRYAKIKDGCTPNKLTDFKALELEPNGEKRFLGNIVLLTNKQTFSAAEDFAMMMRALPNVTHIGDNTWGGFATGPMKKKLSNGWEYRISRKVNYDLNKQPIVHGIVPDELIHISEMEEENNVDAILERAIELLT